LGVENTEALRAARKSVQLFRLSQNFHLRTLTPLSCSSGA
jgi:hypothetical protein